MSIPQISYCPGTLAPGFETYSSAVLRRMFGGHKVHHVLDFDPPSVSDEVAKRFRENVNHMSISGAQAKQSLILDRNKLRLTEPGERGQFILKPIPDRSRFANLTDLPANEHLTMQIARQVYGIQTAENALIFFKNGEPAYITRRFDRAPDGTALGQEDFASLLGFSKQLQGDEFKYMGSYFEIAKCMQQHVPAYLIDAERLYILVMFNHLIHNQDAHLKNFSLRQTVDGDYRLSPAYDLLNSEMHVRSGVFFALEDGLYEDFMDVESYPILGYPGYDDFFGFGLKLGIPERRVIRLLDEFRAPKPLFETLVQRSYLSDKGKELYMAAYRDRHRAFSYSLAKRV